MQTLGLRKGCCLQPFSADWLLVLYYVSPAYKLILPLRGLTCISEQLCTYIKQYKKENLLSSKITRQVFVNQRVDVQFL